jgi:sigma-E factor negative regulatory protein RseC
MLTETGRIVAVENDSLWVETIRQSTCGTCSAQKGCGHGLLNKLGNGRSHFLRVVLGDSGSHDYQIDDEVQIGIPEHIILQGSVIVYILPLLMTLSGAALGQGLWPSQDLQSIVGALLGFGLGICLVRWHAWLHRDDIALQPQLLGAAIGGDQNQAAVLEVSGGV